MPVIHEAADFKSDVSTYFTTRALNQSEPGNRNVPGQQAQKTAAGESRTCILARRFSKKACTSVGLHADQALTAALVWSLAANAAVSRLRNSQPLTRRTVSSTESERNPC